MKKYDYFWNRSPGDYVDKKSGKQIDQNFDGNIRDWYGSLVKLILEIIQDDFGSDETPVILVNQDACIVLQVTNFWRNSTDIDYVCTSYDFGPMVGSILGKYKVYPIVEDDTIIVIQDNSTKKVLKLLGFKDE